MALYRMEPSLSFQDLEKLAEIEKRAEVERLAELETLTEPERIAEVETAELDGPAEIGSRGITGEVEKYMLLTGIKAHGIIKYLHNSPRTIDQILNSVECLNAQIEYLHSKRR